MKLYFGNMVTTVTTIMVIALVGFIGYSVWNRNTISFWGRRNLFLLMYGLVICCFAAARDGLDKTIQAAVDGSCTPGIFPLVSIPTIVGCIGAAMIIVAAVATPIAKSQRMREIWFYVMSSGVMLKVVVMELARIIQFIQEMLEGCFSNPTERMWHTTWSMELKNDTEKIVGDFCFKGIGDDGAVEIGYFSYGEGISAILDGIC